MKASRLDETDGELCGREARMLHVARHRSSLEQRRTVSTYWHVPKQTIKYKVTCIYFCMNYNEEMHNKDLDQNKGSE